MISYFCDENKYVSELYVCTKCIHETLIYFKEGNIVEGILEAGLTCKYCNEQVNLIAGDLIVRFDWPDTGNEDGSQLQCAYLPNEYVEICSECAIFNPIEWTQLRCACPFCDISKENRNESMVSKKIFDSSSNKL
jgi:hypothetical protein